jgi:hypothetical protein
MTNYWSRIGPFWNDCPTDDPAAYLAFCRSMPAVARDLLTTHWVVSEVCNGGFHQLFTNPTGVLVPEAVTGFRSMGLVELADITAEAASFFSDAYPREQMPRIEALERYAASSRDPDDWNPFDRLDDQFYSALDLGGEEDAYTSKADAYADS